jgi:hypothetical protein
MVYVAWPVDCEIVTLATPELHDSDATPPPLDVAIVRSYDADVRVNVPPVEDESVTTTLVAFTTRLSATELVAMVMVASGEVKETFVAFVYVRDAAFARRTTPLARATSNNTATSIISLLFISSKAWVMSVRVD